MSTSVDETDIDAPRLRTLTEAGLSLYEKRKEKHLARIAKSWDNVEIIIDSVGSLPDEIKSVKEAEADFYEFVDNYETLSENYIDFLTRARTEDSFTERDIFENKLKGYRILIQSTQRSLRNHISELLRKDDRSSTHSRRSSTHSRRSSRSNSSKETSRSSVSTVVMKSKVKAEAAKTRLKFMEEEAELKKKQVVLDVDLEVLQCKKEAAVAVAEMEVLESMNNSQGISEEDSKAESVSVVARKRTKEYVREQKEINNNTIPHVMRDLNDNYASSCLEENEPPDIPVNNTGKRDRGFQKSSDRNVNISTRKTVLPDKVQSHRTYQTVQSDQNNTSSAKRCPLHNSNHSLDKCRGFRMKPIEERRQFLKENKLCFRCFETSHRQKDCTKSVECNECGNKNHSSALHIDRPQEKRNITEHSGEIKSDGNVHTDSSVESKCTQICGKTFRGNDRPSLFSPCVNNFRIKENVLKSDNGSLGNAHFIVGKVKFSEKRFFRDQKMTTLQKPNPIVETNVTCDSKDLYRAQWKRVQILADMFWKKWKTEFLQQLQNRRKWKTNYKNVSVGDVVLLKDNSVARCYWPIGRITATYPSDDGKVRKVSLQITKSEGGVTNLTRPITEVVLLVGTD
ncbi:unnamed protein product [Mytilus coruscus]|uniref:DUF5641 domain-containing protein n=1 Tax=Mytilus coruscus TaxID=42192 RepID=A0A6J8BNU4_MYTCO|nr:unnamed protein product [Mytilus coruscus]